MGYPGARRLALVVGVGPLLAPLPGAGQHDAARPTAPSWAAGVPDTLWILVEASYGPGDPVTVRSRLRAAEDLAQAEVRHVLKLPAGTARELEILEESRRLEAHLLARLPEPPGAGPVSIGGRRW